MTAPVQWRSWWGVGVSVKPLAALHHLPPTNYFLTKRLLKEIIFKHFTTCLMIHSFAHSGGFELCQFWMQLAKFSNTFPSSLFSHHFLSSGENKHILWDTLYCQKYWDTPPNHWIQVFLSLPWPQMYKIKHLGMQTASTNICERMGRFQKLSEFKHGTWSRLPPVR